MTTVVTAGRGAGRSMPGWLSRPNIHLVDSMFVIGLTALGLLGFRTTFGGTAYLVVGAIGAVLGVAASELARRLRQPFVAELAFTLVVFLVLAGTVASRSSLLGGILPTGSTFGQVLDAAVRGWKELLTTAPPVGNSDNLLTIPYLVGLASGTVGYSLAWRTRLALLPAIAPLGVLAVGILFGTNQSAALLLQGSLLTALLLVWSSIRSRRKTSQVLAGSRRSGRGPAGLAIIAVASVIAVFVGPRLPFTGGHQRVVLEQYVVPPFDANSYPSPLSSFRTYTPATHPSLYETTLYKVTGLPAAPPGDETARFVRFVTMDGYDGLAWGFQTSPSSNGNSAGDVFRRYGSVIESGVPGETAKVTVTVEQPSSAVDPNSQWLPDYGDATTIQFSGPNAPQLSNDFRYNTDTLTAVDTELPEQGDSYTLGVVVPPAWSESQLQAAPAGTDMPDLPTVNQVETQAQAWAGNTDGAWNKVMALAAKLRQNGFYSDGTQNGSQPSNSLPGNSAGRLTQFLTGNNVVGTQIVGDDEQYAATLALMANYVGVPARVVLGAVVEPDGSIKGSDVQAWVEVQLGGLGWVLVPANQFEQRHRQPSPEIPHVKKQQGSSNPVAPPTASSLGLPPSNPLPSSNIPSAAGPHRILPKAKKGSRLPGWLVATLRYALPPIALVALVGAAIRGLKTRRRRRRRTVGAGDRRLAGAWAELIDQLQDYGYPVSQRITRREQAQTMPIEAASALAVEADAGIFGPGEATGEQVEMYWQRVEGALSELRKEQRRWVRLRAAFSLSSFRRQPSSLRLAIEAA